MSPANFPTPISTRMLVERESEPGFNESPAQPVITPAQAVFAARLAALILVAAGFIAGAGFALWLT